jgi:hypothetical protein
MPLKICLLLAIALLNAGCHGLQSPTAELATGTPEGYAKFKPRRGYLDKANYVNAARDDAAVVFRDFDTNRFYLSGVFITNYTGHEMDQKKVLVRFTQVASTTSITTLLYQIAIDGRVLEVTRQHDDGSADPAS